MSEVEDSVDVVGGVHYVRGSVKVWHEEMVRIGDHKLVTGKVQIGPWRLDNVPISQEKSPDSVHGWRRRDGGDRKFWDRLVEEGNVEMSRWMDEFGAVWIGAGCGRSFR